MIIFQKNYLLLKKCPDRWDQQIKTIQKSNQTPVIVTERFNELRNDLENLLKKPKSLKFKEGKQKVSLGEKVDDRAFQDLKAKVETYLQDLREASENEPEGVKVFRKELLELSSNLQKAEEDREKKPVFKNADQYQRRLNQCAAEHQRSDRFFKFGMSGAVLTVFSTILLLSGFTFMPFGLAFLISALIFLGLTISCFVLMGRHHAKAQAIENSLLVKD